MFRRLLSVLIAVPILALSACGGSDEPEAVQPVTTTKPQSSPTPSQTPTPTPSEVPRPSTTPEAAKLAVTVLGTNVAKTPEERAVVAAWMTYWTAVSKTYDELEPAPGLDSARGKPLTQVLDYLDKLKARNHRSVGWTRENVLRIGVSGDSAVLTDCAENFSFEVDAAGKPTEKPSPYYSTLGQLTRDGDRWIVTTAESRGTDEDCRT